MIALKQRLLELENKLYDFDDRWPSCERAAKFDENTITELRARCRARSAKRCSCGSSSIVSAKQPIRRSTADNPPDGDRGLLEDHKDVSSAVQLERWTSSSGRSR